MMRNLFLSILVLTSFACLAQQAVPKCGYAEAQHLLQKIGAPQKQASQRYALKTTNSQYTIPVIFHIVLNNEQLDRIGGERGLRDYIETQLSHVNADFSAQNADSIHIPAAFKPLYGNAEIHFALAHTAPDGTPTKGYEIITTTKKGFEISSTQGSGSAFSEAKYNEHGGADAWPTDKYLNIWVVNMLENNVSSNYVGITLSPADLKGTAFEPEIGVVLNYRIWTPGFKGRILTHELGHYLSLLHTWGNNELCPGAGGEDDGIADTPPQADATYNECPTFPKYDGCSATGNGIMFMNFMDYTDENCQNMFTKEQVSVMRSNLDAGGVLYDLTANADAVLSWPAADPSDEFSFYPNPAKRWVQLYFPKSSRELTEIRILNTMGRISYRQTITSQDRTYILDLDGLPAGAYIAEIIFKNTVSYQRIILQ